MSRHAEDPSRPLRVVPISWRELWSSGGTAALATPTVQARFLAMLYVAGGLVILAALVLPRNGHVDVAVCLTTGSTAVVVGLLLGRWGRHLAPAVFPPLILLGTALVTLAAGATDAGEPPALAALFVFAVLDAHVFFSRRWATIQLLWTLVGCWSLVATEQMSAASAAMLTLMLVTVGLVVGRLIQLAEQAEVDGLTGVANRRGFDRVLVDAVAVAARDDSGLALVMFDCDDFKGVNNAHGHVAGDEVLRAVASVWSDLLVEPEVLARVGGDEFALLIPGGGLADAEARAERFRAAVTGRQTCSAGVAVWQPGDTASLLAQRADVALYSAKQTGRDRVGVAPGGLGCPEDRLADDLAAAIADGELEVHYQPVVDMRSEVPVGVEALVRWEHSVHGSMSPVEFVALAEQHGLVRELGRFVLTRACRDMAEIERAAGRRLSLAVNVSAVELSDPSYVAFLEAALASAGWAAENLTLEVTESLLGAESPEALAALEAVRRLGVRIAIDDFGTGWSSLGRLTSLPVDILKIDKSFVLSLSSEAEPAPVLTAVTSLARAMSLLVVAEGIETREQATIVSKVGCDLGQGYLYSRPVPAAAISEALAGTVRQPAGPRSDGQAAVPVPRDEALPVPVPRGEALPSAAPSVA